MTRSSEPCEQCRTSWMTFTAKNRQIPERKVRMADQEKEILEEEMEQDLSDAEELKEEETEDEEPVKTE